MRQIGVEFAVVPSNLAEQRREGERPGDYVTRVSMDKARLGLDVVMSRGLAVAPVLGADTAVVVGDEILGKPRDRTHGMEMLRRLAGRTHEVLTGIAMLDGNREYSALSVSKVMFGPLSDAEIDRYWDSGEPADKAGGYAVQGRAAAFIARIEGSYSGIVGLPLYELGELLVKFGIERV